MHAEGRSRSDKTTIIPTQYLRDKTVFKLFNGFRKQNSPVYEFMAVSLQAILETGSFCLRPIVHSENLPLFQE